MNKKILIGACPYGTYNTGDDAILQGIINGFGAYTHAMEVCTYKHPLMRAYLSDKIDTTFTNISFKSHFFFQHYQKGQYQIHSKVSWLSGYNQQINKGFFRNKDLFIAGGGTLLSDLPIHLAGTLALARKSQIPTITFGIGMDEVQPHEALLEELSYLEYIYVRDPNTKNRLIKNGIDASKIQVSFDPALLSVINQHNYTPPTQIEASKKEIVVALCLSSERDIRNDIHIEHAANMIRNLQKRYQIKVLLIPINTRPGFDIAYMKPLRKLANTIAITTDNCSIEQIGNIIKQCHVCISSRLHLTILSAAVGVPFIGVHRNQKIADFASLYQAKCFEHTALDSEDFLAHFSYLINNHQNESSAIRQLTEAYQQIQQATIKQIAAKYLT